MDHYLRPRYLLQVSPKPKMVYVAMGEQYRLRRPGINRFEGLLQRRPVLRAVPTCVYQQRLVVLYDVAVGRLAQSERGRKRDRYRDYLLLWSYT